jgi:mannose-6-phosphate isomerase-like protein (cupin superfamily)
MSKTFDSVDIGVSGAERRQTSTDARGRATVPVSRLRFEHEWFITLERDVTIGRGQPAIIMDETTTLAPGSLTVVPRGLPHATERRGRNPLIVLSTLAGAACPAALRAQSIDGGR